MLVLIDNYDSFTWNLYHYLGELGAPTRVVRNDCTSIQEIGGWRPSAIVISPGPCDPDRAGISLEVVRAFAPHVPILGVCLGHQAIAQAFGATITRADVPMHGKVSTIEHDATGVFASMAPAIEATRYHSLIADRDTLPDTLIVNAWTEDGLVMGVRHATLPVHGVQFHPESIATRHGHEILRNFLATVDMPRAAAA